VLLNNTIEELILLYSTFLNIFLFAGTVQINSLINKDGYIVSNEVTSLSIIAIMIELAMKNQLCSKPICYSMQKTSASSRLSLPV